MKTAVVLPILTLVLVLLSAPVAASPITLRLRTEPPGATVALLAPATRVIPPVDGTGRRSGLRLEGPPATRLVPAQRDGAWRVFSGLAVPARIVVTAPGYRPRIVHLVDIADPGNELVVEERLLPAEGPLHLVAELPTGPSPKSVAFLPDNRLVVPLLWGGGADVFRVRPNGRGGVEVDHEGTVGPPEAYRDPAGFVEPLVLPGRNELWLSQMNNDTVHRFRLDRLDYLDSWDARGRWPKVLALVPARTGGHRLAVADWLSEVVALLPLPPIPEAAHPRVRRSMPMGTSPHQATAAESPDDGVVVAINGQPRGMALVGGDGRPAELWVCEFSTGDISIVDPIEGRVVERLALGPGAARHIVPVDGGRRVVYTDMYHGTVSLIDVAARRVLRRRRIGVNVNTVVADPHGGRLFVSERGRNNSESYLLPGPEFGRIHVLDAVTLAPIQVISGRHQPTGLAVSPDGSLLAATDFLDDNVAIYRIAD